MPILRRLTLPISALLLASLGSPGCHAKTPGQTPVQPSAQAAAAPGQTLPPELARRIEVMLRQKAQLPPGALVNVGKESPSELSEYFTVPVTITSEGQTSKPINFLLSHDGKTLAQLTKFDISGDPRNLVSDAGRPARGGPETAPVIIVGFDDLECPFCARIHATLFPALTQRYGDKVRIVYKDFPLEMHPWAMRAAVDVNCLAAQSDTGYWSLVDAIHARASEIGEGTPAEKDKAPTLVRANNELDRLTREQGGMSKVDMPRLDACIAKQDTSGIEASKKVGAGLNLDSTPTLFINGDKIDGALPAEYIFGVVDAALRAEGITPPPPYVAPPAPAAAKPDPAPPAK